MKIVVATGNKNKVREIHEILDSDSIEAVTMGDMGFKEDIVEDGNSFYENARIKAVTIRNYLDEKGIKDCYVLADDSGLEVDYLDKAPGIYSARYGGEDTPYSIKSKMLMEKLKGVPDELRTSRFVCCMVALAPSGSELSVEETMEGILARKEAGSNGFGYDPILYLPEYGCTSAELPPEKKNRISHRGKALRKIIGMILTEITEG